MLLVRDPARLQGRPWADTVEEMIVHVDRALKEKGKLQEGRQVVIVSGFPVRDFPQPNMALLHTVQ